MAKTLYWHTKKLSFSVCLTPGAQQRQRHALGHDGGPRASQWSRFCCVPVMCHTTNWGFAVRWAPGTRQTCCLSCALCLSWASSLAHGNGKVCRVPEEKNMGQCRAHGKLWVFRCDTPHLSLYIHPSNHHPMVSFLFQLSVERVLPKRCDNTHQQDSFDHQ